MRFRAGRRTRATPARIVGTGTSAGERMRHGSAEGCSPSAPAARPVRSRCSCRSRSSPSASPPARSRPLAADGSQFRAGNIISDATFYNSSALNAGPGPGVPRRQGRRVHRRERPALPEGLPRRDADPRRDLVLLRIRRPGQRERRADHPSGRPGVRHQPAGADRAPREGAGPRQQYGADFARCTARPRATDAPTPPTATPTTTASSTRSTTPPARSSGTPRRVRPASTSRAAGTRSCGIPNTACGSGQVWIENQATANLYIYTPYQPNAAATREPLRHGRRLLVVRQPQLLEDLHRLVRKPERGRPPLPVVRGRLGARLGCEQRLHQPGRLQRPRPRRGRQLVPRDEHPVERTGDDPGRPPRTTSSASPRRRPSGSGRSPRRRSRESWRSGDWAASPSSRRRGSPWARRGPRSRSCCRSASPPTASSGSTSTWRRRPEPCGWTTPTMTFGIAPPPLEPAEASVVRGIVRSLGAGQRLHEPADLPRPGAGPPRRVVRRLEHPRVRTILRADRQRDAAGRANATRSRSGCGPVRGARRSPARSRSGASAARPRSSPSRTTTSARQWTEVRTTLDIPAAGDLDAEGGGLPRVDVEHAVAR